SGKTLAANGDPMAYPITAEVLLEDMHAITEHIKERYNKKKIAVMGISWGSVLGTVYAHQHPENLLVYIGMVQITCWKENWTKGYEKVVELAKNDPKELAIVNSWGGEPPYKPDEDGKTPKQMDELGKLKLKHKLVMGLTFKLTWDYFTSPTFRFNDMPFNKDSNKINKHLLEFLFEFDVQRDYPLEYKVPVSYILGERDYQCVYTLAEEYFKKIKAPWKTIKVIPDASHNAIYDQPKAVALALSEIRAGIKE
ncbi:MAG: alpha/beta hydrolase, partial [Clostridiales bacterium]|nr:alpha/beta hydrolase [Clostridiales bacterium]